MKHPTNDVMAGEGPPSTPRGVGRWDNALNRGPPPAVTSKARRGVCVGLALVLGGCGFQPVYMPTASGKPGVAQRELATVNVPVIPERPGQLLRQALQERFSNDSGTPSAYDLNVSYSIAGEGIAIEASSLATRIRLIGTATWTLLARDAKRTALTSGSARAIDGVNVFDSQYFASDLETEARQSSISENIATQIATQLAIWFRKQAAKQAG
jgi:LPS-assembly lipoprotein